MEVSVSTNKRLRTEVRDMISHLPDAILLHILSFLPTKDAIVTSLLSKRWRPLWTSFTTLDLNRLDFQRLKLFHQFVDKALKFVDWKGVKKFVLLLGYYENHEYFRPLKITKLINTVMCNKVEHLELYLAPKKRVYELPSSVFTSNNMKVLKLSGVSNYKGYECVVMVGGLSHVKLPLLEVLDLNAIKFSDFRSFEMLLSACALLKHLVLQNLYGEVNGPLDIGGFSHLVSADIEGFNYLVTADGPQYRLPLNVVSNVTSLRVYIPWKLCLSPCLDVPTFSNLTYLETRYPFHDWESIFKYLHSCPKLEILMINQFLCSESLEPSVDVPYCVSTNLKEFHLDCYQGKQCEFELARFIMKNAIVMRTMSITRFHWSRVTWESQKLKRISECPISSMNCKLLLK